ncbi:hypothetical protein DNK06_15455 [Pseudomonas daroniae]|uniref:DUF4123 domain-containing protein n=1 Tax=Phytopseudomonas daroniae TaxID=2487519 RepID=A0A4Q9QIZ0_9GAMM|nr:MULTISPECIES: DUF4123 domain-containing protein [Pseudomonas]TBU76687.1 hypothetical protein DNK06_15455 [Pseudomonas daroniae]TBU81257.1 hypothetical protein DNK31_14170 [Pseudomonas sp. FRB 228]TBU90536.1 hypothetical protein DNJ99_13925 [Pseudomonas daroniae]
MSNNRWLLLEGTEHLLTDVYRMSENPDPSRLYDGTELAAYTDESLLLFSVSANPSLLRAMQDDPETWPGLLITAGCKRDDLLTHLRYILLVRFETERKGVLRYSIPRTASYFFPACAAETHLTWLGPIQSLSWYGGTWQDSANGRAAWQTVENTSAAAWRPTTAIGTLFLDSGQEQALGRQQAESFLYQWWARQRITPFDEARGYLDEGMAAGFFSADALTAYLNLRSAYAHLPPPAELCPGSDTERLHELEQHMILRNSNKERSV